MKICGTRWHLVPHFRRGNPMKRKLTFRPIFTICSLLILPALTNAQGTLADYERAVGLRNKLQGLVVNSPERANWIEKTNRFWYRKSVKGGYEFVMVDAETLAKKPAFDHEKLAAALSKALPPGDEAITALRLPFNEITFVDGDRAIEINAGQTRLRCDLTAYACRRADAQGFGRFGGRGGGAPGTLNGIPGPRYNFPTTRDARVSPDGKLISPDDKWEAWVNNFNVWVRPKGKADGVALSFDGSEGNYYAQSTLVWSPDSKTIAAYRVRPGYQRKIELVESSPRDQLQPKYHTIDYAKPGDALDEPQPVLFNIETKKQIVVDNMLFPNPYHLTRLESPTGTR